MNRTIPNKKLILLLALFIVAVIFTGVYKRVLQPPVPKPDKKIEEKAPRRPEPKKVTTLIGSYTTKLATSNRIARSQNINTALKLIDKKVIDPGKGFSFNKTVGEISSAKGFVEAPVLDDFGQPQPGLGGGICQVTSTLYNAVLNAGLEVVERHPHTTPVHYVPKGRDATVYDDKDFRFRNNKKEPVLLRGWLDKNEVRVDIYLISKAR